MKLLFENTIIKSPWSEVTISFQFLSATVSAAAVNIASHVKTEQFHSECPSYYSV